MSSSTADLLDQLRQDGWDPGVLETLQTLHPIMSLSLVDGVLTVQYSGIHGATGILRLTTHTYRTMAGTVRRWWMAADVHWTVGADHDA